MNGLSLMASPTPARKVSSISSRLYLLFVNDTPGKRSGGQRQVHAHIQPCAAEQSSLQPQQADDAMFQNIQQHMRSRLQHVDVDSQQFFTLTLHPDIPSCTCIRVWHAIALTVSGLPPPQYIRAQSSIMGEWTGICQPTSRCEKLLSLLDSDHNGHALPKYPGIISWTSGYVSVAASMHDTRSKTF